MSKERKPKRFPALSALWRLILIVVTAGCFFICLTPYFRINKEYRSNGFKDIPDNCLDVVGIGTSHMKYGFNPAVLYNESGLYSYNMGTECQPFSMTYYLLKEVFKTQSPTTAVIDVYRLLESSNSCDPTDSMYYLAISQMEGENRVDAGLSMEHKKQGLIYAFDFVMNHDNWRTMTLDDIKNKEYEKPDELLAQTYGWQRAYPEDYLQYPAGAWVVEHPVALSDKKKEQLDQLIELCKEHNCKPLFMAVPFVGEQRDMDELYGVWDYLKEKGYDYLDMATDTGSYGWHLGMFGTRDHCNGLGAEVVTRTIADYMKANGYTDNHSDNSKLNEELERQVKETAGDLFDTQIWDINQLLNYSLKYPVDIAVRYDGGNMPSMIFPEYNDALNRNGIAHDFINDKDKDYFCYVHNGQLIQDSDAPMDIEYNGRTLHLDKGDDIFIDGEQYTDTANLEIFFFSTMTGMDYVHEVKIDWDKMFWQRGA